MQISPERIVSDGGVVLGAHSQKRMIRYFPRPETIVSAPPKRADPKDESPPDNGSRLPVPALVSAGSLLMLLLVPVVLLTVCGEPVSSIELAEDTLANPAAQLMSREELIRQQTTVRAANRCLGLIESVMGQTNSDVATALKAHGIDLPRCRNGPAFQE